MKLILTHEVTGLGAAGDIVEVKDGYGRNFLHAARSRDPVDQGWPEAGRRPDQGPCGPRDQGPRPAKGVKGQLEATSVKVPAKSGQSGRLFGAVSNGDIAAAVKAAGGPELDKRKIEVKQAIKTLGSYEATVRLHPEVAATLKFEVVPA